MARLRFTTFLISFPVALAVLWSLLSCALLCTFETSVHPEERSGYSTANGDAVVGLEPADDCCSCPDISFPDGTIQQRETCGQTPVLNTVASAALIYIEPELTFSDRVAEFPADSLYNINAPPLFLRLRTWRI